MAAYCTPRPDADILEDIKKARKILIIGCAQCANISYSIARKTPIIDMKSAEKSNRALSTDAEIERWVSIFKQLNIETITMPTIIPVSLCCGLQSASIRMLNRKCAGVDAVLVLSCEAGAMNISRNISGPKIICAMSAKGLLTGIMQNDDGRITMDEGTIAVKQFAFNSQDGKLVSS